VFLGPATQLAGEAAPVSRLYIRLDDRHAEAAPIVCAMLSDEAVTFAGDWLVITAGRRRRQWSSRR